MTDDYPLRFLARGEYNLLMRYIESAADDCARWGVEPTLHNRLRCMSYSERCFIADVVKHNWYEHHLITDELNLLEDKVMLYMLRGAP